jgi:hypothetical protein
VAAIGQMLGSAAAKRLLDRHPPRAARGGSPVVPMSLRRLQGSAGFDGGLAGARTEGAGHAGAIDIAKALKIGRASVYRVLGAAGGA